MKAKITIFLISILLILSACNSDNPENVTIQNDPIDTIQSAIQSDIQHDAGDISQQNKVIDINCLANLDNSMYAQLRDQAIKIIPYEEYEIRLLTWNSQVDNRPHHFDMAVFWVKQNDENPQWLLIGLARLPNSSDSAWSLDEETDGAWRAFKEFSNSPSEDDVYSLVFTSLNNTVEGFKPANGFKFVKANVCEQTWRETIGDPLPQYSIDNGTKPSE